MTKIKRNIKIYKLSIYDTDSTFSFIKWKAAIDNVTCDIYIEKKFFSNILHIKFEGEEKNISSVNDYIDNVTSNDD